MARRIEAWMDAGASTLLAVAALLCTWKLGLPVLLATGWGLLTFLLCFWLLGLVDAKHASFSVREFAPAALEPHPGGIAENTGEDSRVVQLFDPSAASPAAPPDASQEFFEALATLRRSLR
jgi:hypothetical protein